MYSHGLSQSVGVADDSVIKGASGLSDPSRVVRHGAGSQAFGLQYFQASDASFVFSNACVVEDAKQRASHSRVARCAGPSM